MSDKFSILDRISNDAYQAGREDTINIFANMFDEPCNYNNIDEFTNCEWCSEHCENHSTKECWIHAIDSGWLEQKGKSNERDM